MSSLCVGAALTESQERVCVGLPASLPWLGHYGVYPDLLMNCFEGACWGEWKCFCSNRLYDWSAHGFESVNWRISVLLLVLRYRRTQVLSLLAQLQCPGSLCAMSGESIYYYASCKRNLSIGDHVKLVKREEQGRALLEQTIPFRLNVIDDSLGCKADFDLMSVSHCVVFPSFVFLEIHWHLLWWSSGIPLWTWWFSVFWVSSLTENLHRCCYMCELSS